ncbi:hypothetical protein LWI29_013065 [Acer saccharum]|uniref:Uncharacterized protein n=1 Tax=Acer saccharum TaxID=4024 RepID=A0AA39RWR6_ACESA|nr:hypothetical protein LWI29_013065 [Acer saccharum]
MQLKLQLLTLKKGGLSMTEYLMKKKSIIDALSFTGYMMTEGDKIMYILNGLGPEYDPFVIPVTSLQTSYSMAEITTLLLTHEARFEQHSQHESLSVNLAATGPNYNQYKKGSSCAQFAFSGAHFGFGRGNTQGSNQTCSGSNRGYFHVNNSYGGRRGRERGRNNNNQSQCQICHRLGHTAQKCYYRFSQTFQISNNGQSNNFGKGGAGAACINGGQMSAMVASPEMVADPVWYPDSGATDHCTPDGNNLMNKAEYQLSRERGDLCWQWSRFE